MIGARPAERPGYSATTAHLQAAYPFIAQGGIGAPGAYVGADAAGGAWAYDPWAALPRTGDPQPEHAGPGRDQLRQVGAV